jgi:hypothetical protein
MNREKVMGRFLAGLERAGRDWARIDKAIEEFKWFMAEQAGQDEWSTELREYYLHEFRLLLEPAIREAVEREEYEWAEALTRQSQLLQA